MSALSVSKFALENALEPVLELGLAKIASKGFLFVPISGDGHCLFRAIAIGHFRHWKKYDQGQKKSFLETVKGEVQKLDSKELQEKFTAFEKELNKARAKKVSTNAIAFFRHLACEYNMKHREQQLKNESGSQSIAEYCKAMTAMNPPRFGGETEIAALAQALHLNIQSYDVVQLSKQEKEEEDLDGVEVVASLQDKAKDDSELMSRKFYSSPGDADVVLVYNSQGMHYDLAVKE